MGWLWPSISIGLIQGNSTRVFNESTQPRRATKRSKEEGDRKQTQCPGFWNQARHFYTLKRCRPVHGLNTSTLNDIEHQFGMKIVMQSSLCSRATLSYLCGLIRSAKPDQRIWPYLARNRSEGLMLSFPTLLKYRLSLILEHQTSLKREFVPWLADASQLYRFQADESPSSLPCKAIALARSIPCPSLAGAGEVGKGGLIN